MKTEYELPSRQYGVCPKCGFSTHSITRESNGHETLVCEQCGRQWLPLYKYGYENMIVSEKALTNKEKKKQKENLIVKFEVLISGIENSKVLDDIETRHNVLMLLDEEFKILCPKKYNSYFGMGEYKPEYDQLSYESYLNSRSFKMIRDLHKILFYFGK